MTGLKVELHEGKGLEKQSLVSRRDWVFWNYRIDSEMLRIKTQDDRPVAALLFAELKSADKDNFAVILTASGAAPSIDVVVPSTPTSLRKILEPYLEELGKNHLRILSLRDPGQDQLTFRLQSGRRFTVTIRKRIVEGDKVYCVKNSLEYS